MAKQTELPGVERPVNKKVELAGELLISATKKKTAANTTHKKQEQHLLDVMIEEKVASYTSEDLGKTFEVDDRQKVKVSTWQAPKASDGEKSKKGPKLVKGEEGGDLN